MLLLAAVTALVFGLIWPAAVDGTGAAERFSPRLGLDLEGGTSVTLIPRAENGDVPQDSLRQAVGIIRQRVDGAGVAESEVTTSGDNIVVSIPGERDEELIERVQQTAELRFRPVLLAAAGVPLSAPPAAGDPAAPPASPPPVQPPAPDAPAGTPTPVPAPTTQQRALSSDLLAAPVDPPAPDTPVTPADPAEPLDPAAPPTPADPAAPPVPLDPAAPADPGAPPADPALAGITPEVQQAFVALDCTDPANLAGSSSDAPEDTIVACSEEGAEKYLLGPTVLGGDAIDTASAELAVNEQGVQVGGWQVAMQFTGPGGRGFGDITSELAANTEPRNRFGIVLDGVVVSAPSVDRALPGGEASITGSFTQAEASSLANVLRYGALPLSFDPGDVTEVSPTLGGDQLRAGLVAGGIGLLLVAVYSLLYYRGLGLVTVASLLAAGVLTYGLIVLLGWVIGFRLTLAGIAGIIVAIGITADSFVVYFERLRDEIREGKVLRVAVEEGWRRARHTIIVSDIVSLLAAVVLYVLSAANVKGFAFALGLTTLVDLIVVFFFTKPLITVLARTRFFGGGHRMSGLDPERLGAPKRQPRTTLASRRRAAAVPVGAASSTGRDS